MPYVYPTTFCEYTLECFTKNGTRQCILYNHATVYQVHIAFPQLVFDDHAIFVVEVFEARDGGKPYIKIIDKIPSPNRPEYCPGPPADRPDPPADCSGPSADRPEYCPGPPDDHPESPADCPEYRPGPPVNRPGPPDDHPDSTADCSEYRPGPLADCLEYHPAVLAQTCELQSDYRVGLIDLFDANDSKVGLIVPNYHGKAQGFALLTDRQIPRRVPEVPQHLKVSRTRWPDVYTIHQGSCVLYIPDLATSRFMAAQFQDKDSAFVQCRFNPERQKWQPMY
ncbi:hypothetical protein GGF32_005336 [Allomyces javanicus]|nr:hypothetical protein GGF32_005336 [Allomyces javanicus]